MDSKHGKKNKLDCISLKEPVNTPYHSQDFLIKSVLFLKKVSNSSFSRP